MDLYCNLISGFQGDWKCLDWFDTKQEKPHMKNKIKMFYGNLNELFGFIPIRLWILTLCQSSTGRCKTESCLILIFLWGIYGNSGSPRTHFYCLPCFTAVAPPLCKFSLCHLEDRWHKNKWSPTFMMPQGVFPAPWLLSAELSRLPLPILGLPWSLYRPLV